MQILVTAVRAISALNRIVGLTLAWLSLAVVLAGREKPLPERLRYPREESPT